MNNERNSESNIPRLTVLFYIMGVVQIVGGVVLCIKLWPGTAESGYRWLFSVYTPALTWLSAGIIFGLLFFAAGYVLTYLENIRHYLHNLNDKTLYKSKDLD